MYQNIFFVLKNTSTRLKSKKAIEKTEKQKETKEKKKQNVVVVSSICGKPNVIQNHLQICSVHF